MGWSSRLGMVLACALGLLSLLCATTRDVHSQEPKDKKSTKTAEKKPATKEPAPVKEPAPKELTVDQMKALPGTIMVLVEELKDAFKLKPRMVLLSVEEFQKMVDQIQALQKKLQIDKATISECHLAGKLDGEFIHLKADFLFTTTQPRTQVALGLKGAHLTNVGGPENDRPTIEIGDDGFTALYEKPDTHRLTLQFLVKVGLTRGSTGSERGFDLSLPGAAITTLLLDLPPSIKEVRWNDTPKKDGVKGRFEIRTLGLARQLNVAWKEPIALPGTGPLLVSDGAIDVRLDESKIVMQADLTLEDLRGQTKEWQLLLPAGAKVDVKARDGVVYDLLQPDAKTQNHVLRFAEASSERFQVQVRVQLPRPVGAYKLPVGPFFVQNAFRQQGLISIHASPDVLRTQRLVFHRLGEIYQRDVARDPLTPDLLAQFQYWSMNAKSPKAPPNAKYPLEIEWKVEKGQVATSIEHTLRLRPLGDGIQIDATSRIKVKSLHLGVDSLDIQLPRLRPSGLSLLGQAPLGAFPASIPWGSIAFPVSGDVPYALPGEFFCEEEALSAPDATGKGRIKFSRPQTKEFTLILTGRYLVPMGQQKTRLELPRPLGTWDRGCKIQIATEGPFELLVGPPGQEEPVLDRQQWQTSYEQSLPLLDLTWRAFQPELPADLLADVSLRGDQAQVRLQMQFVPTTKVRRDGTSAVRLQIPDGIKRFGVLSGGKLISLDAVEKQAWLATTPGSPVKEPLILEYFVDVPREAKDRERAWSIPFPWPEGVTQEEAKVRVWCDPGIRLALVDSQRVWKDRGNELVIGRDALPALVLHGAGHQLDLGLKIIESSAPPAPALVCNRGLIQVVIDDAGNHHIRARYLVQKIHASHLDIEFPLPANTCVQNVEINQVKVRRYPLDDDWKVLRLEIDPGLFRQNLILDIEYKLPASFTEGKRFWQTMLYPPVFRGDVLLGKTRWMTHFPSQWVGVVPSAQADIRWGLQGWLIGPEPLMTSGELEQWLTGQQGHEPAFPISLSFARTGQDAIRLIHLTRPVWLLVCSGSVLFVGMLIYFLVGKSAVAATLLGFAVLAAAFIWPGWVPAVVLGVQPGILVLFMVLSLHWLLQERYRRQVIFMPGFTRMQTGSSLIRGSNSSRQSPVRGEPSTVDAPSPTGSQNRGSSIQQGNQ